MSDITVNLTVTEDGDIEGVIEKGEGAATPSQEVALEVLVMAINSLGEMATRYVDGDDVDNPAVVQRAKDDARREAQGRAAADNN